MSITNITLTRTYSNFSGLATSGTVSFILSNSIINGASAATQVLYSTTVSGSGVMGAIVLPANDDPGTSPEGTAYQVLESITYPSGIVNSSYYVVVPHVAPSGAADLAQLHHYTALPSPPALTLQMLGQPNGVATLDSSGLVPTSEIPGGGGGGGGLPTGGTLLQSVAKKSTTNYDTAWVTVNGLIASVTADQATSDPLDQEWCHGTFTAEMATVTLDVDGVIYTNGSGFAGVEIIYSQSVLSGNLWNGAVNGVVSGAHRTRVLGSVAGQGVPSGIYPNAAVGTLGFGTIRSQVTLTGLTVGQPVYIQVIPVLIDAGNPLYSLASTGTFMTVSPSRRGYIISGATVIPVELGRDPSNWLDAAYPAFTAGFPIRAFVTSDGKSLWTSGLGVGQVQVFDTDSFANTHNYLVSSMAPYGMCQDPTGTNTVDIANFGGAYCTSGAPDITTFAPAFTAADVGKTLTGGLAAAFPANTKVSSFTSTQHVVMSANATTTVGLGNIASFTPCVLDGIAYVADQGNNKIQLFDVVSGAAGSAYTLTSPYVPYTLAVSPDGSKLAVYCKNSTSDYRLLIINARTGSILFDIDTGNNAGVLPDPVWEPDSVHGWLACFGSNLLRRFNASTGSFETAHDTTFSQPQGLAITPSGRTLFVAGGNASASTWAYFMLSPLPSGALVQYDGNHTYGAVNCIALGPDCFIYALTSSSILATVRGGSIGCLAASQPGTYHLEVRAAGGH